MYALRVSVHTNRTKAKIEPLNGENRITACDNKGMCHILNRYFSSVFTREDMSNVPCALGPTEISEKCTINDIEINEQRISKAIDHLKNNKAAGVDDLNSSFIKGCSSGIVKPLNLIFKQSLVTGQIPCDWKKANVTAIFKKGSKKEAGNYRPISLTCQMSKILEKIIKEDLVNFLESNKLILE